LPSDDSGMIIHDHAAVEVLQTVELTFWRHGPVLVTLYLDNIG
jgi:hypothetical protein